MKETKLFSLAILLLLLVSNFAFGQNAPINFETGGYGADWTWAVFENATNPALEIVDNPSASGANTSSKVAKFTVLQAGAPWAGCESAHGAGIGTFTLSAANCIVKIMVYKPVISDVGIKFAKPDGWAMQEIKVANTLVNQWEELTFDFSAQFQSGYDQIIIFPDFNMAGRTQDNICYFDNITFNAGSVTPEGPTVAAPTPTVPADKVISLFSNAYTNVTVDTWSAGWDNASVTDLQIAGNDTKLYQGLGFAGIEFTSQTINATAMTNFHLDIWTPVAIAGKEFKIKLVDFGADGVWGGGDDVEHELTITESDLSSQSWKGLDIPLANFTGLITRGHLAQLIISGTLPTFYVDNIYFHNSANITIPTVAAPSPTVPANKVISLFSNAYTNVSVDTWSADWDNASVTDLQIAGNDTKLYEGLGFAGIEFTSQTVNATAMTNFYLDIWTPVAIAGKEFKIKLVDFGADGVWSGGDDVEHEITLTESDLSSQSWKSIDIPLANFTGLTTKGHLAQLIISGTVPTFYVDNIYFHNNNNSINNNLVKITSLLNQNYPNPFNPTTNISYSLSKDGFVSLSIYDMAGRVIKNLVNENKKADNYQVNWNASNDLNHKLASGVYYYQLKVDNKVVDTKSMILIK